MQQSQPEKGLVISGSDATRWPLRRVGALAEGWRNLEWILEEGVLTAALTPAAVVGAMVCPSTFPPLNFPQDEAL